MLRSGVTVEVTGGVVTLRGADGSMLGENARLARGLDAEGTCPSEGFLGIDASDDRFVVRNQTCGGWYLIDERLTFAPSADGWVLVRFSADYLDRRDPEHDEAPRVVTARELGHRPFAEVDPERLYRLLD